VNDRKEKMSMDIKELLQIANEKAVRINELLTDISRIDNVIPGIERDDLVITDSDEKERP